jgi:mannose-1-phosphate guanylyltransferase / phosphomannomutase
MQAVILAGGEGTRLHSVNTSVPKPLAPLFDRPVLEHTITLLARHGITDIILTVASPATELIGYFGNGSAFGVKIRYSVEADPLGTAGAVKLIQGMLKETFVVVSGDVVTDADLGAALTRHRSASAVATLLLHDADDPTQFGVVDCDSAGKITRIIEKPKSSDAFSNVVNTGIYILEPEALGSIPHFGPCDFTREVFPRMLANQEPVYGFAVQGYWCDIGNLHHYRRVHFDALEGKLNLDLPAAHIGHGIWMGERLEVHNSV